MEWYYVEGSESVIGRFIIELTVTQNSSFEQTDRDGYQITFGIGVPFDPFADS